MRRKKRKVSRRGRPPPPTLEATFARRPDAHRGDAAWCVSAKSRVCAERVAVAHRGQRRVELLALVDHELPVAPVLPPRRERRNPSPLGRRRVDVGRALGALAQKVDVVARPERPRRPIGLDLPDLVVHRPAVVGGTQQTVLLGHPGRRAFTADSSHAHDVIHQHGVGAAVVVVLRAVVTIQPM